MKITLLTAYDQNLLIGVDNDLPWDCPEDRARFAETTRGQAVVMGYNAFKSLPDAHRPLPDRHNIVMTRNQEHWSELRHLRDAHPVRSPADAMELAERLGSSNLFVIGGAETYISFSPYLTHAEATMIHANTQTSLIRENAPERLTYFPVYILRDETWAVDHAIMYAENPDLPTPRTMGRTVIKMVRSLKPSNTLVN